MNKIEQMHLDAIDSCTIVDNDVPSLGHRINCLNKAYTKIGVSVQNHVKWDTCAVLDMIW